MVTIILICCILITLTKSIYFTKIEQCRASSQTYLSTRISETVCVLIDNVITNNTKCNHISGVHIRKNSEHQIHFNDK